MNAEKFIGLPYESQRAILKGLFPISLTKIHNTVFSFLKIERNDKCQKKEIVLARQIAIYFMAKKLPVGNGLIGDFYGKDRTTVIYTRRTVENLMSIYPAFKQQIAEIDALL